jgi:hypothetical protein
MVWKGKNPQQQTYKQKRKGKPPETQGGHQLALYKNKIEDKRATYHTAQRCQGRNSACIYIDCLYHFLLFLA